MTAGVRWSWGWPAVLALLVTAPLLTARGFALVGDMVFVPDQPWKPTWLGLDGSVPRAVPSDALTSVASQLLPGDLVQKVVLVALLFFAGWGVARLVAPRHLLSAAAATSLYVWNPFVHERLAIGHWALLCGYAALPWVVMGARALRQASRSRRESLAMVVVPLALAAWTSPSGGLVTGVVALVVVGWRGRLGNVLLAGAAVVVVNLPWLVPGVLNVGDQLPPDVFGVAAFAARADTPGGVVGSLLSLGGLWKDSVDPATRDVALLSGIAIVLTLLGVVGAWLRRARERAVTEALLACAVLGLVVAWLPSTGWGEELVASLVEHVPGAGLLRDSQKFVMPAALLVSWGIGSLAEAVLDRRAGWHARWWVAALVVAPLLLLPTLAWGLSGTLRPVTYPMEWSQARAALESADAGSGATLVLPFQIYRRYDWNADRAVLDPAPRFFPGEVVTEDALPVRAGVVGGESRTAARIRDALGTPEQDQVLREEGIRRVLLQKDVPGAGQVQRPAGTVLHEGPRLLLVELGAGGTVAAGERRAANGAIVAADLTALLFVLGAVGARVRRPRRAYTSGAIDTRGAEES